MMKVVITHCVSMAMVPAEQLNTFLTTVSLFRALKYAGSQTCVCVCVCQSVCCVYVRVCVCVRV